MDQTKEELLALVWAHPDDDGPRHVLADHLLEIGDPVGELLALQLGPMPLTEAQQRRERRLLKDHLESWLGPLWQAIAPKSARLVRGFLESCTPQFRQLSELRRWMDHPGWSTVREVTGRFSPSLLLHPSFAGVRRVRGLDGGGLYVLAKHPVPLGIETIRLFEAEPMHPHLQAQIIDGHGLDELTELTVGPIRRREGPALVTADDWSWLLQGHFGAKLQRLRLENVPVFVGGLTVGAWRRALDARKHGPLPLEAALGSCVWRLTPEPKGWQLTLLPHNPNPSWLTDAHESLRDVERGDFTHIRIVAGAGFTPRVRAALLAAIADRAPVEIVGLSSGNSH